MVDDDRAVRETMRVILGPEYRYAFAESAYAAEQAITESDFDLVLLDLHLPGGSGLNLLPTLRQRSEDTEVIVLTAFGTYEAALEAIRYRVAAFLEKDFSPAELQGSVRAALGWRRNRLLAASMRRQLGGTAPWIVERLDDALTEVRGGEGGGRRSDHVSFLRVLAEVLESQDAMTAGHSLRVSRHAVAVARQLKLPEDEVGEVEIVAHLHDIGKVGINKTVLNREGRFTKLDRVEIERHPILGAELVKPLGLPMRVVEGVRYHHERLNGSGYPDGLRGDDIPLYARIIAVVDSFDAMTWPRVYRRVPFSPVEALGMLEGEINAYDSRVVDAFGYALERGAVQVDPARDPIRLRQRLAAGNDTAPDASFEGRRVTLENLVLDSLEVSGSASAGSGPGFLGDDRNALGPYDFVPLADYYADTRGKNIVPVVHPSAGFASFVDPGDGEEVPLLQDGMRRLSDLVRQHRLRPFFVHRSVFAGCPHPRSMDRDPTRRGATFQELTDGRTIWFAEISRGRPSEPSYRIREGWLNFEVAHAEIQEDAILDRLGDADPPVDVLRALDAIQRWIGEHRQAFVQTPLDRRFRTHLPWVEYHRLSTEQLRSLVADVPGVGRLSDMFRDRATFDDAGAVLVTFDIEPRAGRRSCWDAARSFEIESIPCFTREMEADVEALRQRAGTVGGLVADDRDPVALCESAVLLTRVQSRLWKQQRGYTALLVGAALERTGERLGTLPREELDRHLGELTLADLPVVTHRARALLQAAGEEGVSVKPIVDVRMGGAEDAGMAQLCRTLGSHFAALAFDRGKRLH